MQRLVIIIHLFLCCIICRGQTVEIHQIGVGTGDATLIIVHNTNGQINILLDAGPSAAATTVLNYLKAPKGGNLGAKPYLDYVIASHYHEDHIGGLVGKADPQQVNCMQYTGVLGIPAVPVDFFAALDKGGISPVPGSNVYANYTVFATNGAANRRIRVGTLAVGQAGAVATITPPPHAVPAPLPGNTQGLSLGGVINLGVDKNNVPVTLKLVLADAKLYAPNNPSPFYENLADSNNVNRNTPSGKGNPNNWGLAWVLEYGLFRYFTGGDIGGEKTSSYIDIETPLTGQLPVYYPQPTSSPGHICAFKIDHHGSDHSTNQAFMNTLRPTVSAISSGKRFLHPKQAVIGRLEKSGWDAATLNYDTLKHYYMTELHVPRNINLKRGYTSGNVGFVAVEQPVPATQYYKREQMPNKDYLYLLKDAIPEYKGDIKILVSPENTDGISITTLSSFIVKWKEYDTGEWEAGWEYDCHEN